MTPDLPIAQASLHQRDAGLDVREAFIAGIRDDSDAFVLATCHRVEISCVLASGEDPRAALSARLGVALPPAATIRMGRDAVLHLMRLACGLDSVVRGEAQVLGQLRRTFDASRSAAPIDPVLALILRRTLELGRELRRTTALGAVSRSLGSLAVDAAFEGVADPASATILVIGAGEMGKLALRALGRRAGAVLVANRDVPRAAALADLHGATALPLERIAGALGQVVAVISAADTRGAVLTLDLLRSRLRSGPLTVIDLAVPRSVDPDARALPGLRYVDVDGIAIAGAELAPDAIGEIEAGCEGAADAVMRELNERRAAPAIRALRERTESIRKEQLDRALGRLGHLSERDRGVVEALSDSLAHALMHEPTVRLRAEPERERAARDLFAL